MEIVSCDRASKKVSKPNAHGVFSKLFKKKTDTPPKEQPTTPSVHEDLPESEVVTVLKELLKTEKQQTEILIEIRDLLQNHVDGSREHWLRSRTHYKFARGSDRYEKALQELKLEP